MASVWAFIQALPALFAAFQEAEKGAEWIILKIRNAEYQAADNKASTGDTSDLEKQWGMVNHDTPGPSGGGSGPVPPATH